MTKISSSKTVRERKCLVTGETHPAHRMIRFVLDPAGRVTPDLAAKLPGRGGWIRADRKALDTAVKKKIFVRFGHRVLGLQEQKAARSSKAKAADVDSLPEEDVPAVAARRVHVDENLPGLVEQLLLRRCLESLGLVNRAGLLISGYEKVRAALKANKCRALVTAQDAADNGRSKICSGLGNVLEKLRVIDMFSREQLGQALGLSNAVHVALLPGGMTEGFLREFSRYEGVAGQNDKAIEPLIV